MYQAEHLPSPNGDPGPVSADAVLTAMQDIFCEMQCGTAAPVDPKAFATAVGWDTTEHHDMHELKNRLLGVLQVHSYIVAPAHPPAWLTELSLNSVPLPSQMRP